MSFLFDRFERNKASAYVPLKGIKTAVVRSQKYFWWVRLILIIFENGFEKGCETSRYRRIKWCEVGSILFEKFSLSLIKASLKI